jgi:hypothetical protein
MNMNATEQTKSNVSAAEIIEKLKNEVEFENTIMEWSLEEKKSITGGISSVFKKRRVYFQISSQLSRV